MYDEKFEESAALAELFNYKTAKLSSSTKYIGWSFCPILRNTIYFYFCKNIMPPTHCHLFVQFHDKKLSSNNIRSHRFGELYLCTHRILDMYKFIIYVSAQIEKALEKVWELYPKAVSSYFQ